jgi:hypothetical protein
MTTEAVSTLSVDVEQRACEPDPCRTRQHACAQARHLVEPSARASRTAVETAAIQETARYLSVILRRA